MGKKNILDEWQCILAGKIYDPVIEWESKK
jgi:hypothetical protein